MLGGLLKEEAAVQPVSFGAKTDFATGDTPFSVAMGDFNGDGKLDLAVANVASDTVSILLGTGTGSFGAKTDFGTGNGPFSVAVGDFNGDGKLDLAVANVNGFSVSILLGTGTGSFGARTDFGTGDEPRSVAVADFNGDGKLDLAVANFDENLGDDTVSILLGTGTGSFGAKTDFGTGNGPFSVAVGDFNGDGNLDLAVANGNSGTVSILLGTGTGSFGAKTDFGAGEVPNSVAVGDFNGDGRLDLAVANQFSLTVSILLGTGTGSFGAKTDFATDPFPNSVVVGDFNGDGKLDLAVANGCNVLFCPPSTVSLLLGTGTGSFGAKTNFDTGENPRTAAVGDFNGDGKLDLAVANGNSDTVSILLNTTPIAPSGVFCPRTDFATADHPLSVAVGDFNGDGKIDLTVANGGSNSLSILLGMGTGSFGAKTDFGTGDVPVAVAIGDFNGDGNLDLAVANQGSDTVSILLGTGTGSFGAKTDFGTGDVPVAVAIGDFNGDGNLDLAVANQGSDTVSILLGTGTGGFGAKTDFDTGGSLGSVFFPGGRPGSVAVGDFNGDGNLDLAVANVNSSTVAILLGTGSGSFGAETEFGTGLNPGSVAVGDFNEDGKLDLALTSLNVGTVSVLLGTGTGSFGAKTDFGTAGGSSSVAVGDFNGDGTLDLAVATGSNSVSILLGTGTGSFGGKTDFGTGSGPRSVAVGDFNDDGKLDLSVANVNVDTVSILLNNTPPSIIAAPVARNAGNSANSQIALVDDAQDAPNTLSVTVNGSTSATVNGVAVTLNPTAPNASGQVFADIVAACTATTASFTLRVTDSCGPFAEATLTVTVNPDHQSPTINCAAVTAQSANANANCQAVVPDVRGLVRAQSADCTAPASLTVTQNPAQGSIVSGGGSHPIVVTVTDASNNSTNCTVAFTVNDVTAPTINCAAVSAQSANADANCQAVVPDVRALVRAQSADTCTTQASLTMTQNPVQGSIVSGTGTHPIVLTVTDDSNNSTTCTVAFTVNDVAAPTINCSALTAQSADANANCQATVPDVRALVRAQSADNCTAKSSLTVTQNPAQGSIISGAGSHPITVSITDASNNSANCIVAFTVIDNTPPTIVCPASFTVVAGAGCPIGTNNTVSYAAPTVSDNCPGATSVCNPPSGSAFPVGTTTVNCTASDASGNTASCSFVVTVFSLCVQDNSNPGNVVLVDSSTGAYRFCCNGVLVASGTGTRIVRGCTLTISDSSNNRLVQISMDGAVMKGTASVKQGANILCTSQDSNLANNTCVCQ
jgi:VCBS repeat protein/HYR domain-containing protein/FG-GAP repeat protein